MQQFAKENAKMDMASEMMGDAVDDALDDDEVEDETDDLMNQVNVRLRAHGHMPLLISTPWPDN